MPKEHELTLVSEGTDISVTVTDTEFSYLIGDVQELEVVEE